MRGKGTRNTLYTERNWLQCLICTDCFKDTQIILFSLNTLLVTRKELLKNTRCLTRIGFFLHYCFTRNVPYGTRTVGTGPCKGFLLGKNRDPEKKMVLRTGVLTCE